MTMHEEYQDECYFVLRKYYRNGMPGPVEQKRIMTEKEADKRNAAMETAGMLQEWVRL